MGGRGKGGIYRGRIRGQLPGVANVGAQIFVDDHFVCRGRLEVYDRVQGLVVDQYGRNGVLRLIFRASHHHGDGVAGVADLADRQGQMRGRLHVGRDRPGAGHAGGPLVAQVGAGKGGNDTGLTPGAGEVDRRDPGMVMAAVSLLAENPDPTEADVRQGLEGNLCRCTGYHNIVKAILAAAQTPAGAGAVS